MGDQSYLHPQLAQSRFQGSQKESKCSAQTIVLVIHLFIFKERNMKTHDLKKLQNDPECWHIDLQVFSPNNGKCSIGTIVQILNFNLSLCTMYDEIFPDDTGTCKKLWAWNQPCVHEGNIWCLLMHCVAKLYCLVGCCNLNVFMNFLCVSPWWTEKHLFILL